MEIRIREGSIAEATAFSVQVFQDPHPAEVYKKRFKEVPYLILVAESEGRMVGFKVGYERDGYWYSWLGGVHADFRRQGIANLLADAQDAWAQAKGYPHVTCKTRNYNQTMLVWAIKRGFRIWELQPREKLDDYRVVLRRWY